MIQPLRPLASAGALETRSGDRIAASIRTDIVETARHLSRAGLVVGSVGNVSARVGDTVWITPSRLPYADMEPDDIVPVPLHVTGAWHKAASRELPMHLAIYRRRPDVRAVVHTHSVHATAWSFLDLLLEPETEEVSYYKIGAVRTSQWALSGSPELAQHAAEALGNSRAALLARHGVVAAASTVEDARIIAEAVEHQAHVAWLLRTSTAT